MTALASRRRRGRPARTASPHRPSTSAAVSPSKTPSVAQKPAGTSSRSPCQPQRSAPSATAITCSCGWSSGASQTYRPSTRPSNIPSADGECRLWAGWKSKSSVGPATTGNANWVNAKPRKSGSPATRSATCALGRANEPVATPVSAAVARNRSCCQPSPAVRSKTTPSGTATSPGRTSRSVIETSSPRPPWASGRCVLVEELEERGAERLTAGALVVDDVTGSVDHDDVHGG